MAKKRTIGILFGGRSCEHEVSVVSARSVVDAVDRDKFDVVLIGIDQEGVWHITSEIDHLVHKGRVDSLHITSSHHHVSSSKVVSLETSNNGNLRASNMPSGSQPVPELDIIFPILHGTFGEDGTLQGAMPFITHTPQSPESLRLSRLLR